MTTAAAAQPVITVAPPAVPFKYTDHRPTYNNTEHYEMTNEQIPRLQELTAEVNPSICGAIASGGEIPLMVMLLQPNIKQCVAIDQAYQSLQWAHLKAAVIHLLTPDEAHKLLTKENNSSLYPLPSNFPTDLITQLRAITPQKLHPPQHRSAGYDLWSQYTTVTDIGKIKANLDKLHLVHGDIRDLPEFSDAKYDIIYLSNATEKTNHSTKLTLSDFNHAIRKFGHILTTGEDQDTEKKWVSQKTLGILNGHPNSSWSYHLLQYQGMEFKTYARQAWERMRDLQLVAEQKRRSARNDAYFRQSNHCSSCGRTRDFDCYPATFTMYCSYCRVAKTWASPPHKIVRLHDRYIKE